MDSNIRITPWGRELLIRGGAGQAVTVKILTIEAGRRFSLQKHKERDEAWTILSPNGGIVTIGEDQYPAKSGRWFRIPAGTIHRLTAPPVGPLEVLEAAFGTFDQEDIIRLEDDYGRV